tara:strand:+ start:578 stop:1663 length:1086 start_codon:yes stop_codon:yes gene_type:complete
MEVLRVFKQMEIKSASGVYNVEFDHTEFEKVNDFLGESSHFIVDSNLIDLYPVVLQKVISSSNAIIIDASEHSKEITRVLPIIESLLKNGIKRNHTIVAIGGGVIQDITCFISSVLFRGVNWKFVPTTLLAQADSCIGSKSSINLGKNKNILGTFKPPQEILICPAFLKTLDKQEILSGIGEIIKVHVIDGIDSADKVSASYDELLASPTALLGFIERSLYIKKKFIEQDEFDQNIRNIFNYGHSFGHAIESATQFAIPHGIAVTIGMDMANRIAAWRNLISESHYNRMHGVLSKNYEGYKSRDIPLDKLIAALKKDKKNTAAKLVLIMPVGEGAVIQKVEITADNEFVKQCDNFLMSLSE